MSPLARTKATQVLRDLMRCCSHHTLTGDLHAADVIFVVCKWSGYPTQFFGLGQLLTKHKK